MDDARLYTDDEAELILRRAAKGVSGGITEDRLVQMADEVGISRDAVVAAARQVREEELERRDRREFAIHKRRKLVSELVSYVTTCVGLGALNWYLEGHISWAWWVIGPMGFGILSTIGETLKGSAGYEKSFLKWRAKRQAGETIGYTLPKIGVHIGEDASEATQRIAH